MRIEIKWTGHEDLGNGKIKFFFSVQNNGKGKLWVIEKEIPPDYDTIMLQLAADRAGQIILDTIRKS